MLRACDRGEVEQQSSEPPLMITLSTERDALLASLEHCACRGEL
jgi:hypothetical protein